MCDCTFRPQVGETRDINVEKSSEPLGFQIQKGSSGGIFVSSVSQNSLASHAGIEIGDQLLEVNLLSSPVGSLCNTPGLTVKV